MVRVAARELDGLTVVLATHGPSTASGSAHGAAMESNHPTGGLLRPAGFEDRMGHQTPAAPVRRLWRAGALTLLTAGDTFDPRRSIELAIRYPACTRSLRGRTRLRHGRRGPGVRRRL